MKNIGQAAAVTGVSAKMIRHYESIGLIPSAERTDAGYRMYSADELETLRFIRRSRDLGFSIERIRELLALWRDRGRASAEVKRIALAHVAELEAKMRQLGAMADTLRHLSEHCHGDSRPHCPILRDLGHHTEVGAPVPKRSRTRRPEPA
jgi:Cu(I)-responsive transcriptional regulator